ncbi:MAG: DNA-3-methyladenine glycosylase [Isosphaeraceae bacterium]
MSVRTTRDPWSSAVDHLVQVDSRWTEVIDWVGPCRLRPRRDRFGTLVRAIIGQQISTKAAASIDARLRAIGGTPHDPVKLLDLGLETIRTAGLSGVKAGYLLNLSEAVADGRLPLKRIGTWTNEEIIAQLTTIKGIGLWTAEMFLVFALNRPDVLSVGDLGVRVGLRNHHALAEVPHPKQCEALAEPWRPYRTVAMWYLWRGLERPGSRA